jgi:hypothetical protein
MENYMLVEEELDQYATDMLSNSIQAEASLLISGVRLDESASLSLDIMASNSNQLGGEQVPLTVDMGQPLPFLYSDIAQGKEHIMSLRTDGDEMLLMLESMEPFETKHITLEKQSIVMHTLDKEITGKGLGDGSAIVTETVDFQLDFSVPSITFPEDSLVDGASPSRPLDAGRHTMTSERTMPDAYTESIENFKVYDVGLNSRTQYSISITSMVDLESIPLLIDLANDSRISSFDIPIYGYCGGHHRGSEMPFRCQLSRGEQRVLCKGPDNSVRFHEPE